MKLYARAWPRLGFNMLLRVRAHCFLAPRILFNVGHGTKKIRHDSSAGSQNNPTQLRPTPDEYEKSLATVSADCRESIVRQFK
jgi:hypothetical protein